MHSRRSTHFSLWRGMLHGFSTFLQGVARIPRQTNSFEVHRRGGRWIIGGEEHADGRLVCDAAEERRHALAMGVRPPRLVALRRDFRRIASRGSIAGLFMCVDHKDLETVRLGIWLMGRTHSKSAISEVGRFVTHSNACIRRETARALRRLGAWAKLRDVAAGDADLRVQRLATPRRQKPFAQRLHQLARSISANPANTPAEPVPLFVQLPSGPGRLPKSTALIRAILERIRRALSA